MNRNRTNEKKYTVQVSELDALTIYCAMQTELARRRNAKLPHDEKHQAHLQELIDEFRYIADAEPCTVCGYKTLTTFGWYDDGSPESGPTTIRVPCCGSNRCVGVLRSELESSLKEETK